MSDDPFAKLISSLDGQKKPPVDRWNPPYCGDLDIRIDREGRWYYMGSPIGREKIVHLFASVLRKDEDGKTYLVTPVEKIGITVDDAPFVVVDIEEAVLDDGPDQTFVLTTNVGDQILLGSDNPLILRAKGDEPRPYVPVRGRLEARINRATYYRMVDIALEQGGLRDDKLYIMSGGAAHFIGEVEDA